jgi:hypothetical protein
MSQEIGPCTGEGGYSFSVDAITLSEIELDQACYVIVFTFQGSGEVPTTPGTMQSWSSGPFLPGSSWDPITVSVPYVNSGPGATAWTILVENLCFIQPGIVATGVIGLDSWQVQYTSACVTTEVLVPP